ncbi:MAG: hypothetical protein ACRC35_05960 [Angustibacter sp.]
MLGFLLTACGGESPGNTSSSPADLEAKYIKCMRENGVDIDAAGDGEKKAELNATETSGGDSSMPEDKIDDPELDKAFKACEQYVVAPNPPSAEDEQKLREKLLGYAKCMRTNGIDFPDPDIKDDGSMSMGGNYDPTSAEFTKADKTCGGDQLRVGVATSEVTP